MVLLISLLLWTTVACAPLDYSYKITRDYFGDIFVISNHDCGNSDCEEDGRFAAPIPGEGCTCQCAPSHYIYREDLADCVEFITECPLTMFLRPYIADKLPVVSLPLTGQLVYPGTLFQFPGIGNLTSLSICEVISTEFMTPHGWKKIFQEGSTEPVFGAYQDGSKTFLQWLGRDNQRHQLQHRLMLIRLKCQDKNITFESCSALKIGWSPGLDVAVTEPHWVRRNNFIIIGLCVGILSLTYIFAICIYMKVRRNKPNRCNDHVQICSRQSAFRDLRNQKESSRNAQFNPIERNSWNKRKQLLVSERYPSSTCISEEEPEYPSSDYLAKQNFVLSEEYFEPEMLASPPPLAEELLSRVRQTIALSSRRLRSLRFKPTLLMIPEDDYFYPDDYREMKFSNENARQQPIVETICGPIPRSNIEHNHTPPCPPPRRYRLRQKQETTLEGPLNNKFDMFRQDLYQKLLQMNNKTDVDNILEGEEKFDESEETHEEGKISRRLLLKRLELKNEEFGSLSIDGSENLIKEKVKLENTKKESEVKDFPNIDVEALYKQWSNQIALKLLENKVPNIECETEVKETGILGQFLKEFKNAIGRIGHSSLPKSESFPVGENWTLKSEAELISDKSLAQLLSLRSRLSESSTLRMDSLTDISDIQDSQDSLTSVEDFKGDSETSGISSCDATQSLERTNNEIDSKNDRSTSIDIDSLESEDSVSLNSSTEESNEDSSECSLNDDFSRNRAIRGLEIVEKLKEVEWQHVCQKKYRIRSGDSKQSKEVILDHNDNEMQYNENKKRSIVKTNKRPVNGTCKDYIKHRKTTRSGEFCLDQNEFRNCSEISGDGYVTLIAVLPSESSKNIQL